MTDLPFGDPDPIIAQAEREIIRQRGFSEFVKRAWHVVEGGRTLAWNWHMELMCKAFEAMARGEDRSIICNVPPRTTKSTIWSVMGPCWMWAYIDPALQFMLASYSWGLSQDHAYKRRAIIESEWYRKRFPEIQLRGDRNNIMNIATSAGGMIYSTSSGGTIMGRGADVLGLDDPNDVAEPESEVQRATLHRWFDVDWSSRANDLSRVRRFIVQQRTHTEDVTGHALKSGTWRHIKIPMEYEPSVATEGDPRKAKGELIDPVRFPRHEVEAIRKQIGPYFFAGQYQQEPFPLGGGMIKAAWFQKWKPSNRQPGYMMTEDGLYHFDPMQACSRFAVVDPAVTKKEIGADKLSDPDYTVIGACAALATPRGPYLFLLDLVRERMEGPDIIPRLEAMHRHWKFSIIGIETVAFQLMLFQQAKRAGLPVREISTKNDEEAIYRIDKDKEGRVMAATAMLADQRVYLPEYAPWVGEFLAEVTAFPNAAHDDMTDVIAYACAIASKVKPGQAYSSNGTETRKDYPENYRHATDEDKPQNVMDRYTGTKPPRLR